MKNLAELAAIREKMKPEVILRKEDSAGVRIVVCMGTRGIAAGARDVLAALVSEVNTRMIPDTMVTQTGCIGMCDLEPIVLVQTPKSGGTIYVNMTPEKALEVVESHILNHQILEKYTRKNG